MKRIDVMHPSHHAELLPHRTLQPRLQSGAAARLHPRLQSGAAARRTGNLSDAESAGFAGAQTRQEQDKSVLKISTNITQRATPTSVTLVLIVPALFRFDEEADP